MFHKINHIVGTFLIETKGSFLNSSTIEKHEGFDLTTPKIMKEFNTEIPYVSAQAWRHWLRETYREEYPEDPATHIMTTGISKTKTGKKYSTSKVGHDIDPVKFVEHDVFGYMSAKPGQGAGDVKATIRKSPFKSSILVSIRKSGWESIDKGFAYPKGIGKALYKSLLDELITGSTISKENKGEINKINQFISDVTDDRDISAELIDKLTKVAERKNEKEIEGVIEKIKFSSPTPLPYMTRFYNTHLQGIFGLETHSVGVFRNAGDREELEYDLANLYLKDGIIEKLETNQKNVKLYRIKDWNSRIERVEKILRSLSVLRGGAKQTQFGTDISPKIIIVAGINCGNLIFNNLFEETIPANKSSHGQDSTGSSEVRIKLNALKQIIWDYADRIVTPVYIGIRTGYLSKDHEQELIDWINDEIKWNKDSFGNPIGKSRMKKIPDVRLTSPIDAIDGLIADIKPD